MGVQAVNYCPFCGKECFSSAGDAKKALRNQNKRRRGNGSFYFCQDCNSWHISHHSFRKSKAIKTIRKKKIHDLVE